MQVTGMGIGFIDVRPEDALEYNRWWDVTMGPENAALPELAAARRYVAPPDYQALRGPVEEKGFEPGRGTYCHLYMYSIPDLEAGMASMAALATRLGEQGRGFGKGWSRYQGPQRLVSALARKGAGVDAVAVPYVGHVAIHFSIGVVAEKAMIPEVAAWHDEVRLPDILETPGFLAAMRLSSIEPESEGRFINVFYLDEHPKQALAALASRAPELSARGRLASPGDAIRPLFGGPYRPLVPLQYDFL